MSGKRWRGRGVLAVVGVAVAALVSGMLPGTAAAAVDLSGCHASGNYEVCMTDPPSHANRDTTIVDRLRDYVNATGSGDTIRIAMYSWTLTGIADDVVHAYQRGVDVKVVVDKVHTADLQDSATSLTPYHRLVKAGIPVTSCPASCTEANGHIMHNKFFLFDTGGKLSVVQTSHNLTNTQLTLFNNLVKVDNDPKLYDFYLGYWNRMSVRSWTYGGVTWGQDQRHADGTLKTKGYAFPRDSDIVLGILNNITACSADGDGDGDGDKKIWVAEMLFTGARERIRNRLGQLYSMGCNVKVVVGTDAGSDPDKTETWVQSTTSGGYNLPNDVVLHTNIHHKMFLVDAKYNGRWQEVVFTGSHNLTGPSLTQDNEALLRIEDPFVFDQYRTYYDGLFNDRATN